MRPTRIPHPRWWIEEIAHLGLGQSGALHKCAREGLQSHRGTGRVLGCILELDMVGTGRIQSGPDRLAGQLRGVAVPAEVAQVNATQAVMEDGGGHF